MTARGFYTLLFGAVMVFTALSVGSEGALLLGIAALTAFFLALLSVLAAYFTCRLSQKTEAGECSRGESCPYSLSVSVFTPLPVAPISVRLSLPSGRQSELLLAARPFGTTVSRSAFPCPHVGVYHAGLLRVSFSDCFGLFMIRHMVREPLIPVTVLPVPRDAAPLQTSPGEGESHTSLRAQADRTTPTDVRAWQEGDELKRVHWKLSMRRQELMVHTYETPQRPDALVLLNLAAPPFDGARRAAVIDALTETCAGILSALLEQRRSTRMPMTGDHPRELSGQEPGALSSMLHALAQESFSRPSDFTRVLTLASRRMRRTGSAAVITAELTPAIADALIALSRMGPRMRVCLVTPCDPTEEQAQLLHLLETCGMETEHIAS